MDEKLIEYAHARYKDLGAIANIFTMEVEWVSEETASKLGYTQEEVIGMSGRKLMALDYTAVLKLVSLLKDVSNKNDSQPMVMKDGTSVDTTAVINGFTYDGVPYVALSNLNILGVKNSINNNHTYMKKMKCLDCDMEFTAESPEDAMKQMHPHYMEAHQDMMSGQNEESKDEWFARFNKNWDEAEVL